MDPDYHCQFLSLVHLSPRDSKMLFFYLINDGIVPKGRCKRAMFYLRKFCFCCCYIPCPPLPSSITNKFAFPDPSA
uniref:Ovule protein n=1 Tax=Romanomermis culicivorax TaxID=13658 RepID=A0A915L275_ROMCU